MTHALDIIDGHDLSANSYNSMYIAVGIYSYIRSYLYRNEIMSSTWLENPNERPTFAVIVQKLSSICNFTETTADMAVDNSIKVTEDAAGSSDNVS